MRTENPSHCVGSEGGGGGGRPFVWEACRKLTGSMTVVGLGSAVGA